MSGNSHPIHPLKPVREPDRKPVDFRATSQKQSNAGFYDDRGAIKAATGLNKRFYGLFLSR